MAKKSPILQILICTDLRSNLFNHLIVLLYLVNNFAFILSCPAFTFIIIIIIIINQGTNARRCPMPFSLFDAIFVITLLYAISSCLYLLHLMELLLYCHCLTMPTFCYHSLSFFFITYNPICSDTWLYLIL